MTGVQLSKRGFLVTTILFFSSFSWYFSFSLFVLRQIVGSSAETYLMVNASFNFIIAISLLLGSFFIHKSSKTRIIYGCSVSTAIITVLLLFTPSTVLRLIIIFIAGVFFSLGQLAFVTYFWSLTVPEERARVVGLAAFLALPITYTLGWMIETFDFSGTVMLGVMLSLGTLVIKLLSPEKKAMLTTKKVEKGYQPEKRTILLYSLPWALFSFVNATMAVNISSYVLQSVPSYYYMFLVVLQLAGAVFGAVGGGIIADFFGRKLSLVISLTLIGIGFILVGLTENYNTFPFVYVANGVSWGILLTLYLLVVWGDLANKESCTKRYSTGLIIFYLARGVGILLTDQISQIPLLTSSLIGCLLIFLSNIPLILAPELLSSVFRERIKLKLYMNVLRKMERKPSRNQG
jgi:MFS family permease